jgi:hypothetical protein
VQQDIGSGDISNYDTDVTATFFNSIEEGGSTIFDFTVFISTIKA